MSDLLRTAIKLADGFDREHAHNGAIAPNGEYWSLNTSHPFHQMYIDALAAQLERQFQQNTFDTANVVKWTSYVTELRRQNLHTDLSMWKIKYLVGRENE